MSKLLPDEHRAMLDARPPGETMDEMLAATGGFGRLQMLVTCAAFCAWVVHGAQVMVMAFVGPAAAVEYASEGAVMKLTGSFFFAGWLLGLTLWGRLAAKRGWLAAFVVIECCVAVSGLFTACAASGQQYLASRFLCGFFEGGVPTTIFGWAGEFLLPADKPRAGVVMQMGFKVGSLLVTYGAYLGGSEHWRLLSGCVSLCAVPLAALVWVVPESPRWLLRNGHLAKSKKVLALIARVNGKPSTVLDSPLARPAEQPSPAWMSPSRQDGSSSDDGGSEEQEREWPLRPSLRPGAPKPSFLSLLASDAELRRVMAVLCFHWFVYSALFFGLSLHEAHNLTETAISVCLQIPALVITGACFDRVGRRTTMLVLLTGASAACAAIAIADATSMHLGKRFHEALSTVGMVLMAGAFSGGYVLTSELLPTDVRAMGLATCSQCSRVGGFFSPLLLLLDESNAAVPYALWAALTLSAGLATLQLPETLGQASLESLDDLHALLARKARG